MKESECWLEDNLIQSIAWHRERAESLLRLSMGEPVRSYARLLSEAIQTQVIPVIEHSLHCLETLGTILESDRDFDVDLVHSLETLIEKSSLYLHNDAWDAEKLGE